MYRHKDFQIGFVEGILKDVMSSEKEPKDVFSKIAKAIAKRTGSGRSKTDWNAMVRRSTMVRNPIGSAAEVRMRQSRQSLRRHIIANQSEALATMDPEKLLEYNPKLAVVSPAARVAYAKFKMSKIKQEYDKRQGSGRSAPGDAVQGLEEPTGTPPGSIVRPRPRSSSKSRETAAESGAPPGQVAQFPEPPVGPDPEEVIQMSSGLSSSQYRKDFRSRTPIPEDPQDEERGEESKTPPRSSLKEPSPSERARRTPQELNSDCSDSFSALPASFSILNLSFQSLNLLCQSLKPMSLQRETSNRIMTPKLEVMLKFSFTQLQSLLL
uniref:Uncharacterized protein n=1 Tax=Timema shepardi TaxID=629360 RepID=A0A7R9B3A2_TIMSH|nr:unnamed protein product [Timema shepardi]